MNKSNVSKFFKGLGSSVSKHSPQILTGLGIAGMVTTTVLAVKATPKALELIEDERRNRISEATMEEAKEWVEVGDVKISPVDYVRVAWKPYIPSVVLGAASIACIIGANSVNTRRTAALATAYKLSETAFSEYKEKVVEEIGEKKEKVIREKVAEKKINKNPVSKNEVIITEKGNTLCYDSISGRYFKSDMEKIKKAINELNRRMIYDMYVPLNDFYDELELENTPMGDDLGWNLDNGLIEVDFTSRIADDGTPCIVINYHVAPRYDFAKLM